jgi:putative tricarboxylic transport membrane protein
MGIRDYMIGLVGFLFGVFIFCMTLDFPSLEGGHPGPALFPRILSILFAICGLVLIIQDVKADGSKPNKKPFFPGWAPAWNAIAVIAVVVVYILLVEILGFILTCFILFSLLMKKLGVRIVPSVVLSLIVTMGVYLLFHKMLMVPLPWGLIHW